MSPRRWARGAAVAGLVSAAAPVFAGVGLAHGLRRRRPEALGAWLGRACLRALGLRLELVGALPPPERQVVYVSNHTSALDVLAVLALGLPRTRCFLSRALRRVPPVGVIGTALGVFWIPRQDQPAARTAAFQAATAGLRASGGSVYLTPEGRRVRGGIGPFNRGAFHLALALEAPIVPLYIRIPPECDPENGLDTRPGTIEVHAFDAIPTADWALATLDQHRDAVRARYLTWQEQLGVAAGAPAWLFVDRADPPRYLAED